MTTVGTVWFVGAGPGDPELLTLKGQKLIARAGAVLYAGSLVSEAALRWVPEGCNVADSKGMTHQQISDWLVDRAGRHDTVVRLQTGDPSLYGALVEMIRPLDRKGIPVQVVPGVTSAMASAAVALESLTLPEVTQTVIFTRVAGRTPMPEGENLADLARHGTTLCIYLSVTLLTEVCDALREAGWRGDAPILVLQKASWPGQERIVRGNIADIAKRCRTEGIKSQAMIIASPTLGARQWTELKYSKLYDAAFLHRFRTGQGRTGDDDG
uniref:Precorrin-4/cobalt-precorrin-4 C11-methyltransferase n=1 Tax=Candidatus Kentrum sp. TUN TaxID=2126343 RepID=A0A450ZIU2_9GAMM|nr:MAG: precorrin-4/cobalt-precorrin-4 C11-methyltransferase [Candidatus Kentron sp. TUN]VFK54085.1 MAG: precorrin-4/cobalt-precorrin-4 C11-methyltransferase [Candidatus Kentron sp. TUN]VFK55280.1 MAG: precorrin-4/cobalt-precorrin-4 C11-methyltransferase [Candidatus Kentron sp. TUN]